MNPEFTPLIDLENRRSFLKKAALATTAYASSRLLNLDAATVSPKGSTDNSLPWYISTLRWMHTDIAEIDPLRYDINWWKEHWSDKETHTQGVIINAGGIVAYYPTQIPLHRQAQFLNNQDLFGAVADAAHNDGHVVLARLDSGGANEQFHSQHPDWFCVDDTGKPYMARDLYIPCINSPYFSLFMPAVIREIIGRYKTKGYPNGFVDNNWSGLTRENICYCNFCRTAFNAQTGYALPKKEDWEDDVYRAWIVWNYQVRLARWQDNNNITRSAGGQQCLWIGMNGGSITEQSLNFRDFRALCHDSSMIMLDYQSRHDATGFPSNATAGLLTNDLLGWSKYAVESMAVYDRADPMFRLASKPIPETRLWALDGFAGSVLPSWHYINAYHEDRRMYETPVNLGSWHYMNQGYLTGRFPMATVGVVWSQINNDFFGRDEPDLMVNLPQRGIVQALIRARIPYRMIHVDDIPEYTLAMTKSPIPFPSRLLILPNLGVMTDGQVDSVRKFVQSGGNLLATGLSSLFDKWGDPHPDGNFALSDMLRADIAEHANVLVEDSRVSQAREDLHSYLRLTPELRGKTEGPHIGGEPSSTSPRHPILNGFDKTDIIAFGGLLVPTKANSDPDALPLVSFIPAFPTAPTEDAFERNPKTNAAAFVLSQGSGGGRITYMAADLDRRYAKYNLPDHADLLMNVVRWTMKEEDNLPLYVNGPGLVDCQLYMQVPNRVILHLVNVTNEGTWRGPSEEIIPVGPLEVRVVLPPGVVTNRAHLLITDTDVDITQDGKYTKFTVGQITDHEIVVLGPLLPPPIPTN